MTESRLIETRLIEDVRSALDDSTAGLHARPDAAARARQAGRRRRTTRAALVGVPALGLAAGLAVAVTGAPSAPAPSAVGPAAPQHAAARSGVTTVADQTRQIEAALATVNDFIVRSTTRSAGVTTTTWTNPVTQATRTTTSGPAGRATYWTQTTVAGDRDHWHTVYVDYAHQTWWVKDDQSGRLGHVAPGSWISVSTDTPVADIRQAIRLGELAIAGHGTVAGRPAIELEYTHGKAAALSYWVDARTYRPVLMTFPPAGPATTIHIGWTPRTPALVTAVGQAHVPAGFRHVAPPRGFH
jgi:hypothetical protein